MSTLLPPELQAHIDAELERLDTPLPADHWWNRLAGKPIPPEGLTIRYKKKKRK